MPQCMITTKKCRPPPIINGRSSIVPGQVQHQFLFLRKAQKGEGSTLHNRSRNFARENDAIECYAPQRLPQEVQFGSGVDECHDAKQEQQAYGSSRTHAR